jgi:exopolysaccharide biosynthesis polyprenyl glycosylphosphotransferase
MMLRRHQELYFQMFQVIDAFLLCGALWVAHLLRYSIVPYLRILDLGQVAAFSGYIWMLVLILPLGPFILERQGFYGLTSTSDIYKRLLAAARGVLILVVMLAVFMVSFRVPQESISRAALIMFVPVGILVLMMRDFISRLLMDQHRRSVINRQHVLLCGENIDLEAWQSDLNKSPAGSYKMCGKISLNETPLPEFINKLHAEMIDVVIFSIEHTKFPLIREALHICESEGIEAWIGADFFKTSLTHPQFDLFGGRPLLVFRSTPDASWELVAKRIMDSTLSFLLIVLLFPVFLGIALAIWWGSGAPVIFRQRRSGIYGRPFTMYKFRTMVTNAEQTRQELETFNLMTGPVFKIEKDPRVTPIGHWLRRTSLDELPQLFNVLKGHMSLVGPRPLPIYETENFSDISQRRRMSVRPGLTCLWQISGRNKITDFSDWVRLDLEYIDNWSLWLDLKILLLTIPAVLFGRGAK